MTSMLKLALIAESMVAVCASQLRSDSACKSWCAESTKPWDKLCKKDNCAACSQCDTTTSAPEEGGCKSWCADSTKSWEKLCKKESCADCSSCTTTTASKGPSGCKAWCADSTKSWKKLCGKTNCNGCPECEKESGDCKSWCAESTKPWQKLCKKDNCKGCPECEAPACEYEFEVEVDALSRHPGSQFHLPSDITPVTVEITYLSGGLQAADSFSPSRWGYDHGGISEGMLVITPTGSGEVLMPTDSFANVDPVVHDSQTYRYLIPGVGPSSETMTWESDGQVTLAAGDYDMRYSEEAFSHMHGDNSGTATYRVTFWVC